MKNYPWPKVCDETPGWEIPRELVHIIGAIVINWNWCEFTHGGLIRTLLAIDGRIAARIVTPMRNRQRSDLMIGLLEEKTLPDGAKEHLSHFLKCFEIGRVNRNLIVHALAVPETDGPEMVSDKAQKHITSRYIPVEVGLLVGVAKELSAINGYGSKIDDLIQRSAQPSWPEKPPLPHDLNQTLPAHIVERYQPRSSEE